jgi:serine/threonine-protein kinase
MEVGARPLTRLAALAIAARDKENPDELRGVVLEPYRNYRGVNVVGAWRWLSDHGFAVATEIEAEEALAPLVYVKMLFGVLFVLLSAFVASTLISTFSVVQLRSRVRELKELGPYQLVSPIAEGGMGVVYLAEHALLKRRTAVKVLSGELSKQSITRFEREVSLASRLTHPNTIEIYDYGRTPEGIFYYAMEYIDGPTLSELVTRFGPVPPARVIHILRQLSASLSEAHREGLVHRDIKPQNVMLCVRGGDHDVVKVLDFGLVKDVTATEIDELSKGIHIGGTPLYMAPERLTSPKQLDARVDVYSVGCVAYYLLAGRPVFEPEDHLDLLDKIVNEVPRPLAEVSAQELPNELIDLIMACLAKDPAERPETVFSVMDTLDTLSGVSRWTEEDATRWWRDAYRESRRA